MIDLSIAFAKRHHIYAHRTTVVFTCGCMMVVYGTPDNVQPLIGFTDWCLRHRRWARIPRERL